MRIGLFGRGRLGSAIAAEAGDRLAWKVGREPVPGDPVDVAIDASHPDAVAAHLDWALGSGVPLVIGTTGFSMPDLAERVGERCGVLVASNFSLTVALMTRLATIMGRFCELDEQRDPYVLEHHHRMKLDAPSGTARTLARAVIEGCPRKTEWTLGAAAPHQLSVGVVRAGAEFGTHTVGIDAPAETLHVTHAARSRATFARGAIVAAEWVRSRKGVYGMDDVAADILDPLFKEG